MVYSNNGKHAPTGYFEERLRSVRKWSQKHHIKPTVSSSNQEDCPVSSNNTASLASPENPLEYDHGNPLFKLNSSEPIIMSRLIIGRCLSPVSLAQADENQ